MRSVGIVAEYNPFHNGHLYHLKQSKEISGSDVAIVAMSGNFLQRGEPAIVPKWTRTKMALLSGADLVVEIPYAFAVQKAEIFALGSVYLLDALKCSSICFGSELGNIHPFLHTVDLLKDQEETYNSRIRFYIKQGVSYPKALALAYSDLEKNKDTVDLSRPNNILGYHYIAAAKKLKSNVEFFTVKRNTAEHDDQTIHDDKIASATSIRKLIKQEGNLHRIRPYIPEATYNEMEAYYRTYKHFHDWEDYWPYLQYRLLTMNNDELNQMYDIEEGLPYRLQRAAESSGSFQSFMENVKTKRYTWTRLQRICVHALTNTTRTDMNSAGETPGYIRLLGMSAKGREYLNKVKKDLPLPLVSTVSAFPEALFTLDRRAALVYSQVMKEPARSDLFSMEYAQPPIMAD
ncbi:nucleotidyltransferase [Siminovitchia acidinfaciens]|uniref:tRNA(Met) cytidine acetate ligase n=1 Tax=Siminovitchia acidinfaciens TaxID=2321395 RepID=A0A429Y2K3_9BACI|nr:nucleotidyltransferase [Siminovitchia acidinfaciens]RST75386.1 nucleotidyltransferase [Siminovitchia acidinfaciens]